MCAGVTWESSGVRLAVAINSVLYILSIRPTYMYADCSGTLVYAQQLPEVSEHLVVFWNTKADEVNTKRSSEVCALAASGAHAAVVSRGAQYGKFLVTLYDTVGSAVDMRSLHFEPSMAAMTATHAIVCSADVLFVWQYRTLQVCCQLFCLTHGICQDLSHCCVHRLSHD